MAKNIASLFHDTKYKAAKFGLFERVPADPLTSGAAHERGKEINTSFCILFCILLLVCLPFSLLFPCAFGSRIRVSILFIFRFFFALRHFFFSFAATPCCLFYFQFMALFTASFPFSFVCHFYVFSLSIRFHIFLKETNVSLLSRQFRVLISLFTASFSSLLFFRPPSTHLVSSPLFLHQQHKPTNTHTYT